jgi:predicted glutamine amidotransferase
MCLIIKATNPKTVSQSDLKEAYTTNSDGFGIMFVDNNKIVSDKIKPNNFDQVKQLFNKYKNINKPIGLHFRFCTNGLTNIENAHPFKITKNIYLMHNGPKLPIPIIDNNMSDTHQFIKYYLKPILLNKPALIYDSKFQENLAEFIGNDKILFLDSEQNKFVIINEQEGNYKNDNWYSNTYWKKTNLINYHNYFSHNDYGNYKNSYLNEEEEEFEFNQDQQFDKIKSINSVQDIVDNKLDIDDLEILVRDKIENNQEEELAQFIHDLIYQS